ncbi:transcriptional regulator (MarR family) protein [Marinobacter lipolyticus SM19]|uniref:Transcriptional regulator (MarR family) protein n=1 Tax=Marinobacter lipolyticus SM19 TaxID=1318628 RepID=R8B2N6_9GAMM|nr:MarR family transcriptional regulator [Marinobacter lipolyticus]EON92850.1 transcriptional regulator (MarR family) protein [Marinobacter lipolyticus SM19]
MDSTDDILDLDNQLCFALYAANRAVTSLYRPLLTELGLTYPQYLVMLVLWEAATASEVVRVSGLGSRLRLDSGTLTPLLKRLEERGLVRRQRSVEDERVVTVAVTAAGLAMREQAKSIPSRLLCSTGVDSERLMALRDELRSVLARLESRQAPSAR